MVKKSVSNVIQYVDSSNNITKHAKDKHIENQRHHNIQEKNFLKSITERVIKCATGMHMNGERSQQICFNGKNFFPLPQHEKSQEQVILCHFDKIKRDE